MRIAASNAFSFTVSIWKLTIIPTHLFPDKSPHPSQGCGSGAKEFSYKVVDPDGNEVSATIKTDKNSVGEALVELNLIAGETNEYGLYVKSVNNITLDWDKDAMYWGLYVNGEYALTGIDLTEIENGAEYMLKAEK